MCGIVGVVMGPGQTIDAAATLASLRHRGPDGNGHISVDVAESTIWFGHTRLSIQDLSQAGAQPMASNDGRWLITFNGEIYNHLDLRRDLARTWRGHSDTETLVEAISEWGVVHAVQRLNGIFAFAALDQRERKVYLARDPFGVKPVYYSQDRSSFAFASAIRAVATVARRRFAVDQMSLKTFLSLRFVPSPHTLLAGLMRLSPGHILTYSIADASAESSSYTKPVQGVFSGSLDDAIDTYQQHVQAAVRRQLLSDVPVGVLLSGGIDSALVAAMAVDSGVRAPCFTVGYLESTSACEIEDAAHTARVLGLPHHVVRVDQDQLWQALEAAVNATEEPLATTSMLPMWHLCKRAREDVTVVLTGQGSDELLGGYRRYQAELYRRLPLFRHVAGALGPMLPLFFGVPDTLERTIQSVGINDTAARFESEYSVFSPAQREQLIGDLGSGRAIPSVQRWLDWAAAGRPLSTVEQMMAIDMRLGLSDDLLLYGDKVSMAHGLEARVPLLDTDLVGLVEAFPRDFKVSFNRSKIVHKRMAQKYLPSSIVNRPKKGFQVPFGSMIRGAWKERCAATLFGDDALSRLGIRAEAVQKVWQEHQRGYRDRSRQVFALLGLSVWIRGMSKVLQ